MKSNNVKTDVVFRENEAQTEKLIVIDCEVQANPETRTFETQTIKPEIKQENVGIAMPNTICNLPFGLKKLKIEKQSQMEIRRRVKIHLRKTTELNLRL